MKRRGQTRPPEEATEKLRPGGGGLGGNQTRAAREAAQVSNLPSYKSEPWVDPLDSTSSAFPTTSCFDTNCPHGQALSWSLERRTVP